MKRPCLYRCPKCGTEEKFEMGALDHQGMRIVTCGNGCTDDDGWRTVMTLMEREGESASS